MVQRAKLGRGDARDVAGNGEEARGPAGQRRPLGMGDSLGVTEIALLAERAGAMTRGEPFDLGVTRDDEHRADPSAGQRLEHVPQHGARQVSALRRGEERDQPLLGVDEVLDRNRHDHAHARASSVFLAKAISPWRSRMTVSVKMG